MAATLPWPMMATTWLSDAWSRFGAVRVVVEADGVDGIGHEVQLRIAGLEDAAGDVRRDVVGRRGVRVTLRGDVQGVAPDGGSGRAGGGEHLLEARASLGSDPRLERLRQKGRVRQLGRGRREPALLRIGDRRDAGGDELRLEAVEDELHGNTP